MLEALSLHRDHLHAEHVAYPYDDDQEIAFALGGLAGANAHGVGFLHAAQKCGIQPSVISCTSGMICWTAQYLLGQPLDEVFKKFTDSTRPARQPFDFFNHWRFMAAGVPNVCTPNYSAL